VGARRLSGIEGEKASPHAEFRRERACSFTHRREATADYSAWRYGSPRNKICSFPQLEEFAGEIMGAFATFLFAQQPTIYTNPATFGMAVLSTVA
jgi:hypothetical protein